MYFTSDFAPGRNPRPYVRRMGCERLFSLSSFALETDLADRGDRARQNRAGLPGEERNRESTGARRVQSRRPRRRNF